MTRQKGKWKCTTCNKAKQEKDTKLECHICSEAVGLECSNYTEEALQYLNTQNIQVTFICKTCEMKIPEIRNLLEITTAQNKMMKDIDGHDTRITKCEVSLDELTKDQLSDSDNKLLKEINNRLSDLEAKLISTESVQTIAEKCFNKADFPIIKEAERKQTETVKKLEETLESQVEKKMRADKENNLIVFGIPEDQDLTKEDQMSADFTTISKLYDQRVQLEGGDLTQITRIGTAKANQTRPIKISFLNLQKRREILTKNKNLILLGDEFDECSYEDCDVEETHKHIYISTDKTKKQIAEEKALREELKVKKQQNPNLVIRNGKIVEKETLHARWSHVRTRNGL